MTKYVIYNSKKALEGDQYTHPTHIGWAKSQGIDLTVPMTVVGESGVVYHCLTKNTNGVPRASIPYYIVQKKFFDVYLQDVNLEDYL